MGRECLSMVVLRMTFLGVISLIGTITSRQTMNRLLGSYLRANNHSIYIPAARTCPLDFTSYILIQITLTWLNSLASLLLFSLACLYLEFCMLDPKMASLLVVSQTQDNVCLVRTWSAASASFIWRPLYSMDLADLLISRSSKQANPSSVTRNRAKPDYQTRMLDGNLDFGSQH